MKTKIKTQTKKLPATAIPHALRKRVVKQYRTKDRKKRFVVMSGADSWAVQVFADHKMQLIRAYTADPKSEVTIPVQNSVNFELAKWVALRLARQGALPSARQEARRRRRHLRHAVAAHREHMETASVVHRLHKGVNPKAPTKPVMMIPYICLYDPRQAVGDTTFRLHAAYCARLDKERRKIVRDRGGASWVIEAQSIDEAMAMQLAEFDREDKGYDETDFTIHQCGGH